DVQKSDWSASETCSVNVTGPGIVVKSRITSRKVFSARLFSEKTRVDVQKSDWSASETCSVNVTGPGIVVKSRITSRKVFSARLFSEKTRANTMNTAVDIMGPRCPPYGKRPPRIFDLNTHRGGRL
ncbi:hypothetical protein DPMN_002754, partial [Dreissena polymorpha]